MRESQAITGTPSTGKRPIEGRVEAGGGAGVIVEGRLQAAAEMPAHQLLPGGDGFQAAGGADMLEPASPGGDMADLVLVDAAKNRGALTVVGALQIGGHGR